MYVIGVLMVAHCKIGFWRYLYYRVQFFPDFSRFLGFFSTRNWPFFPFLDEKFKTREMCISSCSVLKFFYGAPCRLKRLVAMLWGISLQNNFAKYEKNAILWRTTVWKSTCQKDCTGWPKSKFANLNVQLSNAFWLYQHWVRNAYLCSYRHLNLQVLIRVTL